MPLIFKHSIGRSKGRPNPAANRRTALRGIALALLSAFAAQDFLWAAPEAANALSAAAAARVFSWKIPDTVALVGEQRPAPASGSAPPRRVLIVEDAHTNASGQFNLAKTLEIVLRAENLPVVFTEGASGEVSLSALRQRGTPALRRRVAAEFVKKGELKGSEYLELTGERDFEIVGVEEKRLYDRSVEIYRRTVEARPRLLAYLARMRVTVDYLKTHRLNAALRAFDGRRNDFLDGKISWLQYLEALHAEALAAGLSTTDYSQLHRLKRLRELEESIDFEAANREAARIAGAAAHLRVLSSAADWSSQRAFASRLRHRLRKNPAQPNLRRYLNYLDAVKRVHPHPMILEQQQLEQAVEERWTQTAGEARLLEVSGTVRALADLAELKLTPDTRRRFLSEEKSWNVVRLTAFLNRELLELGNAPERAVFLDERAAAEWQEALKFYTLAEQRDRVFVRRLIRRMDARGLRTGVLIAGGYHTSNLKKLLAREGVSYAVVTPQVSEPTDQKRYENLILAYRPRSNRTVQTVAAAASTASADGSTASGIITPYAVETGVSAKLGGQLSQEPPSDSKLGTPPLRRPERIESGSSKSSGARLSLTSALRDRLRGYFKPRRWIIEKTQSLVDATAVRRATPGFAPSPDVTVLLGQSDLRVAEELAKKWMEANEFKEPGERQKVLVAGGQGFALEDLVARIQEDYLSTEKRASPLLNDRQKEHLQKLLTSTHVTEARLMKFLLNVMTQGKMGPSIHLVETSAYVTDNHTVENLTKVKKRLESLYAGRSDKNPLNIEIVTTPSHNLRVYQTAAGLFVDPIEREAWKIRVEPIYDPSLLYLTDDELVTYLGFSLGYPPSYQPVKRLNRRSEVEKINALALSALSPTVSGETKSPETSLAEWDESRLEGLRKDFGRFIRRTNSFSYRIKLRYLRAKIALYKLAGGWRVYRSAEVTVDPGIANRVVDRIVVETPLLSRGGWMQWKGISMRLWDQEQERATDVILKSRMQYLALSEYVPKKIRRSDKSQPLSFEPDPKIVQRLNEELNRSILVAKRAQYERFGMGLKPRILRLRIPFGQNRKGIPAIEVRPDSKKFPGPRPVVVFFHGLTHRKEQPYLDVLERNLVNNGIAVIRVDLPRHGEFLHSEKFDTEFLNRYTRAIQRYIRRHPERFDARKTGVLGFSFGANVAIRSVFYEGLKRFRAVVAINPPISRTFKALKSKRIFRKISEFIFHEDNRKKLASLILDYALDFDQQGIHLKKVFLAAGGKDDVVDPKDFDPVIRRLEQDGGVYRLYPNEDHFIRGEALDDMNRRILEFFLDRFRVRGELSDGAGQEFSPPVSFSMDEVDRLFGTEKHAHLTILKGDLLAVQQRVILSAHVDRKIDREEIVKKIARLNQRLAQEQSGKDWWVQSRKQDLQDFMESLREVFADVHVRRFTRSQEDKFLTRLLNIIHFSDWSPSDFVFAIRQKPSDGALRLNIALYFADKYGLPDLSPAERDVESSAFAQVIRRLQASDEKESVVENGPSARPSHEELWKLLAPAGARLAAPEPSAPEKSAPVDFKAFFGEDASAAAHFLQPGNTAADVRSYLKRSVPVRPGRGVEVVRHEASFGGGEKKVFFTKKYTTDAGGTRAAHDTELWALAAQNDLAPTGRFLPQSGLHLSLGNRGVSLPEAFPKNADTPKKPAGLASASPEALREVAGAFAFALGKLHGLGIVHNDIWYEDKLAGRVNLIAEKVLWDAASRRIAFLDFEEALANAEPFKKETEFVYTRASFLGRFPKDQWKDIKTLFAKNYEEGVWLTTQSRLGLIEDRGLREQFEIKRPSRRSKPKGLIVHEFDLKPVKSAGDAMPEEALVSVEMNERLGWVVNVGEGRFVLAEASPTAAKVAAYSSDHSVCLSVDVRAKNREGSSVIGHAHIVPAAYAGNEQMDSDWAQYEQVVKYLADPNNGYSNVQLFLDYPPAIYQSQIEKYALAARNAGMRLHASPRPSGYTAEVVNTPEQSIVQHANHHWERDRSALPRQWRVHSWALGARLAAKPSYPAIEGESGWLLYRQIAATIRDSNVRRFFMLNPHLYAWRSYEPDPLVYQAVAYPAAPAGSAADLEEELGSDWRTVYEKASANLFKALLNKAVFGDSGDALQNGFSVVGVFTPTVFLAHNPALEKPYRKNIVRFSHGRPSIFVSVRYFADLNPENPDEINFASFALRDAMQTYLHYDKLKQIQGLSAEEIAEYHHAFREMAAKEEDRRMTAAMAARFRQINARDEAVMKTIRRQFEREYEVFMKESSLGTGLDPANSAEYLLKDSMLESGKESGGDSARKKFIDLQKKAIDLGRRSFVVRRLGLTAGILERMRENLVSLGTVDRGDIVMQRLAIYVIALARSGKYNELIAALGDLAENRMPGADWRSIEDEKQLFLHYAKRLHMYRVVRDVLTRHMEAMTKEANRKVVLRVQEDAVALMDAIGLESDGGLRPLSAGARLTGARSTGVQNAWVAGFGLSKESVEPFLRNAAKAAPGDGIKRLALEDRLNGRRAVFRLRGSQSVEYQMEGTKPAAKEDGWSRIAEPGTNGPGNLPRAIAADQAIELDAALAAEILKVSESLGFRPANFEFNLASLLSRVSDPETRARSKTKLLEFRTTVQEKGLGALLFLDDPALRLEPTDPALSRGRVEGPTLRFWNRDEKSFVQNAATPMDLQLAYTQENDEMPPFLSSLAFAGLLAQVNTEKDPARRGTLLAALDPLFKKLTRSNRALTLDYLEDLGAYRETADYTPIRSLHLRGYLNLFVYLQGLSRKLAAISA